MVHTPIKITALVIDKEQAIQHLRLLGYQEGDTVYLRAFPGEGYKGGAAKLEARLPHLPWTELEKLQRQGKGIYFVVNGGGHTDKDVLVGRALFCEWDDRPIEDQVLAWQGLNLPEPSTQVSTRKSAHNYWRANLTKEQWLELQEDLLVYTRSDQKLKNPSRVLRLAGSWHMKSDYEPIQCDIIHQSERAYTYEELRNAIPRRQQPEQPTINYQPSISGDVPLYQCLTKDDRALIDQGAGQGSRNDSGAKLARNLIGTAQRLNHLGIRFSDDPRHLFHDYCYRCTPSLSTREAETIWKSAQKDNPTPSLTDDALENCAKAWLRNQKKSSGRGCSSGIGSGGGNRRGGSGGNDGDGGDGSSHIKILSLYERVKEILNRQLPDPLQEDALIGLAKSERINFSDLKAIVKEILIQVERADDLKEDTSQFKKLVTFREQQLNLNATLPAPLAKALLSKASSSRLDPIRLIQNLLPACGAVLGANVCVIAKHGVTERDHWYEYPIFWTADISPPSSGKSDAQSSSFEPLRDMEREERERVAEAKKQLAQIERVWQNLSDQEKEQRQGTDADPEFFKSEYVDKNRRYIWDEATIEALFKLISEQPEKAGTVWLKDELESLFKSLDQHKQGGKGNALQQLLSSWGGALWGTTDRADKTKSYRLSGQTLNISGTVQPDVITKRLNVRDDPDGLVSRLLPAMSKLPDDFSKWSNVQVELFDCVKGLLKGLEQMQGTVEFSAPAKRRWIQRWEELRRGYQHYLESNPAYAYFLGKQCSYVPRLALLLHCIEHFYQPKSNFAQITLETLEKAITLSDYYCGQFRLLQAASFSQGEFPLDGLLFKIWEKVKSLGKISTREVCQFARRHKWHGKKITAGTALEILTTIRDAGFGTLQGKTLYLDSTDSLPPNNVDHVDQLLINDQHSQTMAHKGVEDFVDHVDQYPPHMAVDLTKLQDMSEEDPLPICVDQHDQQLAEIEDSQDLEIVDPRSTIDQHDQQLLRVQTDAIAPTAPKQEYTLKNVDADGWGEIVRVSDLTVTLTIDSAIAAPPPPCENPPQGTEAPDSAETPVTEEEWQVGQRITVQTDILSLQAFNERQGIIQRVNLGTCLVRFDGEEEMHIHFRSLRRVDETACVNPSNGGI